MLGEGQQEGTRAVGKLGGDAWRLGEAGGPQAARQGGQQRRCCAAEGEAEEEEGGAGADVKFQKFQGPRCKTRFSHYFISQMRKWSKKNCRTFHNIQLLFRVEIQKLKG
jgi:hypothetical protein